MSNDLVAKIFDKQVDINGDGDVTHAEFKEWILLDYVDPKKRSPPPRVTGDNGQQMNTFERLYLSSPKYTAAIQKASNPKQRRKSLSSPESGGDFRAILRGGYDCSDTAKAWRQNYHTKVDTKSVKYPALYEWEKKGNGGSNSLIQSFDRTESGGGK